MLPGPRRSQHPGLSRRTGRTESPSSTRRRATISRAPRPQKGGPGPHRRQEGRPRRNRRGEPQDGAVPCHRDGGQDRSHARRRRGMGEQDRHRDTARHDRLKRPAATPTSLRNIDLGRRDSSFSRIVAWFTTDIRRWAFYNVQIILHARTACRSPAVTCKHPILGCEPYWT